MYVCMYVCVCVCVCVCGRGLRVFPLLELQLRDGRSSGCPGRDSPRGELDRAENNTYLLKKRIHLACGGTIASCGRLDAEEHGLASARDDGVPSCV